MGCLTKPLNTKKQGGKPCFPFLFAFFSTNQEDFFTNAKSFISRGDAVLTGTRSNTYKFVRILFINRQQSRKKILTMVNPSLSAEMLALTTIIGCFERGSQSHASQQYCQLRVIKLWLNEPIYFQHSNIKKIKRR